jgi:hypothetical protein
MPELHTLHTVQLPVLQKKISSSKKLSGLVYVRDSDINRSDPQHHLASGHGLLINVSVLFRFLTFGLSEPDVGHGSCTAPGGGPGSCRHLQHCLKVTTAGHFKALTLNTLML